MDYLATLALSVLVVGAVLAVLVRVRTPRYRLDRDNVLTLLDMVLEGRATENDWNVFVGIPIRHDPELEALRLRCLEIERREFIGRGQGPSPGRHLFSREGLRRIEALRQELASGGGRA